MQGKTNSVSISLKGNLTPVFSTWTFGLTNSNRNPSSVTFSNLTVGENYFVVIGHFCAYRTLATANVTGISGGTLISWKTGTTDTDINGVTAVFTANATSVTISLSGGSSNTNWGNQTLNGFTMRV